MIVGSCANAARRVLTHPELDAARAAELTTAYLTSALRGADATTLDQHRKHIEPDRLTLEH